MNIINISHPDGILYFEKLKRKEILVIKNDNIFEIFVNIESNYNNIETISNIEIKNNITLNKDITFAYPKLQFMSLSKNDLDKVFNSEVYIKKGWADEFKSCGIYVGWGLETFDNNIKFKTISNSKIELTWSCSLNAEEQNNSFIKAELDLIEFKTKDEFWKYEKEKVDGLK